MPPFYYTLMHPNSRLTAEQTQKLIEGLSATLGSRVITSATPFNSLGAASPY